jgi:hypothetical protein
MRMASNNIPVSFLLLLFAIGCSGGPTSPSNTDPPVPSLGELEVSVNVTGDITLGPSAFRIYVDGSPSMVVLPNQALRSEINTGPHEIAFASFAATDNPWWCVQAAANHQSVVVSKSGIQTVTFALDCPPLVGEGTIAVTVAAAGTAVPAEFPVLITRLSGPPYSQTVNVPASASTETKVPVGVYSFSVNAGPTCRRGLTDFLGSTNGAIIRDGSWFHARLHVTCD